MGVPKEIYKGENRVGLSPAGAAALLKAGFKDVYVDTGAGQASEFAVGMDPYLPDGSCVLISSIGIGSRRSTVGK